MAICETVVMLRLTNDTKSRLRSLAEGANCSMSAWLRARIADAGRLDDHPVTEDESDVRVAAMLAGLREHEQI
jgi:predicted transcriptional regulator